MPHRLLTVSSVLGIAVAGTVGGLASPAAAQRAAAPVTTTVAVPVTCRFTPESPATPTFDATVTLTAPATVRARSAFRVKIKVDSPIGTNVPISLLGLGFTSTVGVAGARQTAPLVLTQAPVDVALGANVPAQVFTRRLTAGRAGSTITYTLDQYSYEFAIATADPNLRITSTCTPTAGAPATIATTRVTR
jgi:hypothetical protein